MKWFKHDTASHRSDALIRLRSEGGLEAYGFYWMLCELVAEKMDVSDRCNLENPIKFLANNFGISVKKFSKLLQTLKELSLIDFEIEEKNVTIKIEELLNIKDEYAKKSGQTPDKVRTNSRQTPSPKKEEERSKKEEVRVTTSSEDKSSSEEVTAATDFAWQGKIIRLTQPDFDRWRKSYHALPDLPACLQAKDDYLASPDGQSRRKNWFLFVSSQLQRDHEAALAKQTPAVKPKNPYREVLSHAH